MISFNSVTKIYPTCAGEIVAIDDVSFEIAKGEFISVVGKSGAGKTTLLKLLLAEEKPTRGNVFFEGQNVDEIRSADLPQVRRRIGSVFQDYKLLPFKKTFENVAYALEVIGADDATIKRDVPKVLDIVGLADRIQNYPEELSGGERQRAAIARALIHRPDVILADEPTGNLDPYNAHDIIKLLVKINEMGTTVVLATHDKQIINSLGKRVITLEDGRMIKDEQKGRFIL